MSALRLMGRRITRLILLASAVTLGAACGDSASGPDPIAPAVRATVVYEASDSASHRSRYVLYNDGTFSLEYWRRGNYPFDYRGRYVATDSVIQFNFDFFNLPGPWQSIGQLHDDKMAVTYNQVMKRVDFINATFVRTLGPR
jgi:hypothetical protein